jgi:hypothetical protein
VRRIRGIAIALLAGASVVGCAVTSGSTRESVGETIHSITASNTIQFWFQADRVLAPLGLKVETYRREVFVSGLVQHEAQRARAVAIARDTPGILAAYFVDTELPGRPVSRAHYRGSAEEVWAAALAAVRAAGYDMEERRDGRVLVTRWRWVPPSWRTLWLATQERMRLALYPRDHASGVVTVIAVSDRLYEGNLAVQIEREEAILGKIRDVLATAAPPGS